MRIACVLSSIHAHLHYIHTENLEVYHMCILISFLQSSGPLNVRLTRGLQGLQQEGEIVAQLLNMAAETENALDLEQGKLYLKG